MKARAAAIYELRTVTQARHRHGSTVAVLDALPHDPPFRDGEAPDLSRVTGAERRALWAVATHRTHAEAARALGVSAGRVSQLVRSAIDHAA